MFQGVLRVTPWTYYGKVEAKVQIYVLCKRVLRVLNNFFTWTCFDWGQVLILVFWMLIVPFASNYEQLLPLMYQLLFCLIELDSGSALLSISGC